MWYAALLRAILALALSSPMHHPFALHIRTFSVYILVHPYTLARVVLFEENLCAIEEKLCAIGPDVLE